MSRFLFLATLVIAASLAAMVTVLNTSAVAIELAFVQLTSPLGVALIVAFTLGLLAGLIWQLRWIAQLLAERGRLRRALRIAESKARGVEHPAE